MRKKMGIAALVTATASLLAPAAASAATVSELSETLGTKASELNMAWVGVACVLVFLMQAGFMFLEIGFSRQKNVGTGVAKILVNFAIVHDRLVGGRLRDRRRRQRRRRAARQQDLRRRGFLLPLRPGSSRRSGERRISDADAVRPRLLRGLAGDRLGHDPGADQVRRLRDLRRGLRRGHLPADRPRGLGRRLPLRHRRQAGDGLRRLLGGPPHRRDRRPGGAAAARPADREVRRRTASRGRSPVTRCRWSASA